jgi:hypothetical protein
MIIRNDNITEASLVSSVTDVDAQAYLVRIMKYESISSDKAAYINDFFLALKNNNLFNKIYAMYPMIGTLPQSHFLEASGKVKNVGQFMDITPKAGYTPTGDSNGLDGRLDDYGYEILIAENALFPNVDDTHISAYSRSTSTSVVYYASSGKSRLYGGYDYFESGGKAMGYHSGSFAGGAWGTMSAGNGFWMGTRSSTINTIYRSGTSLRAVEVLDCSFDGDNFRLAYCESVASKFCFMSFGASMTPAETQTYYNIVQQLQTSLGRQV